MVRENREGEHIDAEAAREKSQPLFEPLLSMLVALPAGRVVSAQKAPPHAAVDAVEDGDLRRIEHIRPHDSGHAAPPVATRMGGSVVDSERLSTTRIQIFAHPAQRLNHPPRKMAGPVDSQLAWTLFRTRHFLTDTYDKRSVHN